MSGELTFLIVIYFLLMVAARASRNSTLGAIVYLVERALGWLTFPGVILNTATRRVLCAVAGIPVREVRYFSFRDPMGYVLTDKISRYRDAYLLAVGPFLVNSVFAAAMFIVPCFNLPFIVDVPFLWLGAAFAVQALPGDGEARGLWRWSERRAAQNPVVLLGSPLVMVIASTKRLKGILRVGFVYAVVLFSVTFCLVASVLIAGSIVIPGAYTAQVVSADAGRSDGGLFNVPSVNYSSAVDAPGYTVPRSYDDIAGKEGSAKDYLPLADAAVKETCGDARLIFIQGNGNGMGTSLPANGKSHLWWYQYVSPGQGKTYDVRVHDGNCYPVIENPLKEWATFDSWSLDSVDAVAVANGRYEEMNGEKPSAGGAYVLTVAKAGENKGSLEWSVSYPGPDGKWSSIYVDDRSGMVV